MNILDLDDRTLKDACLAARRDLMWDARQATDPQDMMRHAYAACCVERYPDALEHMIRNKVLTAFELSLSDDRRSELAALSASDSLSLDLFEELSGFLSEAADGHALMGMDTLVITLEDGDIPYNFKALAAEAALTASGAEPWTAQQHLNGLLREHFARERDGDISLKGEAAASREAADALAGGFAPQTPDHER